MDALDQRTRTITEGSLLRSVVRVALPIVLSNTLQATYQLVNAFFVGRLGETAVAAVAAGTPLFFVLIALGSGLATAGSVFVAQYAGARNHEMVHHVAAQTLLMVVGVSLAFSAMGWLAMPPVLRMIQVGPEIFDLTAQYLRISYIGLTPMFCFMAVQAILQAVGEVRYPLRIMFASVILNAILDPLLIFGFGPVPAMGVAGAAWATVIAQAFALALALHRLINGRSGLHLHRHHFRPDFGHMKRALDIGFPASIEQATRTFGSALLMVLAAKFGTTALAAYGVGTRVMIFFFVPALGLSVATAAVVGQNIGAGNMRRAEQAAKLSAWMGFGVLTIAGWLLIPLVPYLIPAMVPDEAATIRATSDFIYIYAPFMGILAVPQILCGAFRGAGSTKQAMGISLTTQWALQLPISYILSRYTSLGVAGVWWGFPIANTIASLLAIAWFRFGPWRRSLVTPAPAAS